ncbi:MAG: hypothetical protein H2066_05475 [Candidatus Poseidoniales archaeon]|nr:hypothetical protein [Candidatus Poseidoniales archaeon]
MVGEISPDGNFVWNGTEWVPKESVEPAPAPETEDASNVFEMAGLGSEQENIGWEPVTEKDDEGGKGKIIALSFVGLLILSALSWVMYAFVIDPMLFPDPYSKSKFVSVVDDQPTVDDVIAGEGDPWACYVEMTIEEEGMTLRTNYDIYASSDSARTFSELKVPFGGSYSTDVWIDNEQIAWKISEDDSSNKSKVAISGLDSSPSEEVLTNSSAPIDLCFIHHQIVENMDANPSQKFTSDKERFPDEDGVRAVKVETKMEINEDDGVMDIAVYFDDEDNILGTKIYNSSLDCLITFSSDSFSKPSWVKSADSNTPMLLDLGFSSIWSTQHNSMVDSQYNATYSMEGAKVVIYDEMYDDEGNSTKVINFEVLIQDAMNGALIQPTNWNNEIVNCTINFTDSDSDGEISSGDVVSVDCEEDVLNGHELGIANENGVAEKVSMELSWVSPMFTIFALLGAALLISRRE